MAHRTQSQIHICVLVCLFVPDQVRQTSVDLLDPNCLQTLKAGRKRRERERDACTQILCFCLGFSEILKQMFWISPSILLEKTVASDEDPLYVLSCLLAPDIQQYLRFSSFLSHAQIFQWTKYSFLNYICV